MDLHTERAIWYLLVSLAAAMSGCGPEAPPESLLHTDSAGVDIVYHSGTDFDAPELWALGDQPVSSIGSIEGDGALHRVTGAALLSDGSVAILNSGTGQVLIYTRDGTLRKTFGRIGSGPGEFRAFGRQIEVLSGDTIVVFDPRLRRVSTISPSGDASTATLEIPPGTVTSKYIGRLPDGTHLLAHTVGRGPQSVGAVFQDSVQLIQHGSDGGIVAELRLLPSAEMTSVSRPGGAVQIMEMPFGTNVWIKGGVTDVTIAHNRRGELRVYSFSGALRKIIRRDDPLSPLSDEYRKAYPESAYPGITLPDSLPLFDDVVIGSDHLVWLARVPSSPDQEMITWDALDSNGTLVKQLDIPKELTVHQITGNELVASSRDSLGVQYVRVYALDRSRM